MDALCEAYLYYPVEAMDISGKEVLKSNKKFYIVDTEFVILFYRNKDMI